MASIWVLSANSGRAMIFEAESPTAPLVQVEALVNPPARAKQSDLTSDRPGRTFDSIGMGRHAKAVEVDPKQEEQIRFAKLVADRLEQGRVREAFERVALVAAPEFLGHLRASLGARLRSAVSLEIDKDYTALRSDELRARLPERI